MRVCVCMWRCIGMYMCVCGSALVCTCVCVCTQQSQFSFIFQYIFNAVSCLALHRLLFRTLLRKCGDGADNVVSLEAAMYGRRIWRCELPMSNTPPPHREASCQLPVVRVGPVHGGASAEESECASAAPLLQSRRLLRQAPIQVSTSRRLG